MSNNTDFFHIIQRDTAIQRMNKLGKSGCPFLFIIDYAAQNAMVLINSEIDSDKILFHFGERNNIPKDIIKQDTVDFTFGKNPIDKTEYFKKINTVKSEIRRGNSFLTNLTQPTPVITSLSLCDIFLYSKAPYKLWLKDWFTVFSPEIFVRINGNTISSYPMKGTIDVSLQNAEKLILDDKKEKAEHATIVDLIRNDLSRVANKVEVKKFRYVERLYTNQTDLLQVSSHIEGKLNDNFHSILGEIIFSLLPAGSISGAPKTKTMEIIKKAEGYDRGFYTGICGYFDGENIDSAVMIRFIEQTDSGLVFKSGGGITSLSDNEKEYRELIQKVYVPIY